MLVFDDIKEAINGFARIVYYRSVGGDTRPDAYELDKVVEGEFRNGEMEGYCRAISAVNGSCSAGFHKASKPNGKWSYYKYDGTFSQPEGIYEGTKCTQKLQIKSFEQAIANVKPKVVSS